MRGRYKIPVIEKPTLEEFLVNWLKEEFKEREKKIDHDKLIAQRAARLANRALRPKVEASADGGRESLFKIRAVQLKKEECA